MLDINKIYNEDCVITMKNMKDNFIDLVITSPPYGNLRSYECQLSFNFDIFKKIAKELYRIVKSGGCVVWVVGDQCINKSESGMSFKQALYFKDCGFKLHDTMIYKKKGISYPSKNRYHQCFEYMFIFVKGKINTYNLIRDVLNGYYGKKKTSADRQFDGSLKKRKLYLVEKYSNRGNVWEYDCGYMKSSKDKLAYEHPAIFPEQLCIDHIKTWSNENDIIYDPFCGSGTTAISCIRLNRRYIGSEIVKKYFDLINRRIKKEIRQKKLF